MSKNINNTHVKPKPRHFVHFWLFYSFIGTNVCAQQVVKISQNVWLELSAPERDLIQQKLVVQLIDSDTFGVIIDTQGINESTTGTRGGAALGGAVANAAYIDNVIKGGDYSAKTQLAAGILGAVVGSSLDSRPNAQFHYRYTVKLGSGNIQYFDQTNSDPFRHPVGVCVVVPNVSLTDQQLCAQTAISLKAKYFEPAIQTKEIPESESKLQVAPLITPPLEATSAQVNCKLGNLAPVRTSVEKCKLVKGSFVE